MYRISSDSMSPILTKGYFVGVNKIDFGDLKVGDIIVFHRPYGEDKTIVRRVWDIQTGLQNETVITTKGDDNSESVPGTDFPIREHYYIGRVQCYLKN